MVHTIIKKYNWCSLYADGPFLPRTKRTTCWRKYSLLTILENVVRIALHLRSTAEEMDRREKEKHKTLNRTRSDLNLTNEQNRKRKKKKKKPSLLKSSSLRQMLQIGLLFSHSPSHIFSKRKVFNPVNSSQPLASPESTYTGSNSVSYPNLEQPTLSLGGLHNHVSRRSKAVSLHFSLRAKKRKKSRTIYFIPDRKKKNSSRRRRRDRLSASNFLFRRLRLPNTNISTRILILTIFSLLMVRAWSNKGQL